MSFDKDTRNLLAKTVTACRRRLTEDVTNQLGGFFGLHPDGTVLALKEMTHLSPDQTEAAERLRDLFDHYTVGAAGGEKDKRKNAYERMMLEISFTILNRLAALRLCEERGLLVECVRKGTESDGFRLFERVSGGALGGRYETYRVFLECLFDELALDLGVLFDRMTPQSAVFPSERCMEDVLSELNKPELSRLWMEDETIGWIYQYFNPPEERKAMRDASQAPRNSRELAVRNQFFTPRYVVEFLTDNTLGHIWYEMRKGDTALKDECRYLVRRPNEIFLLAGEKTKLESNNDTGLSQEELLKKTVYIEHRPLKDPRDLRILDPACGSGHFLLYTFDVLEQIYKEAWEDTESPKSEITGRAIHEDFENFDDLCRVVPKLIIENNLHGIDIDPRAVQIAALALWLRAQKTWKKYNIKAVERPHIKKSNIVTAEPMPGEEDMKQEFTSGLRPRVLGQLVDVVFEKMKLAGEAGSLLKIEEEIKDIISEAREHWLKGPKPEQQFLFPGMNNERPKQQEFKFDFKGITDEGFWEHAEDSILDALKKYAEEAESGRTAIRRLFVEDASRGFAFVDLCRKHYDVVLMNPPFGEPPSVVQQYITSNLFEGRNDIYAALVKRCASLMLPAYSMLGAITSRAFVVGRDLRDYRASLLSATGPHIVFLWDLGGGVLDGAMVETCAYILRWNGVNELLYQDSRNMTLKADETDPFVGEEAWIIEPIDKFRELPDSQLVFGDAGNVLVSIENDERFIDRSDVTQGLTTEDDFRFIRSRWEIDTKSIGSMWFLLAKGGEYSWYSSDIHLVVNREHDGAEIAAFAAQNSGNIARTRQSSKHYFKSAVTFSRRSQKGFSARRLREGCCFSDKSGVIVPHKNSEKCLPSLPLILSSSNYLSLIHAQSKFGSYEVGAMKRLPWPGNECFRSHKAAEEIYRLVDQMDSYDETTSLFSILDTKPSKCVDLMSRILLIVEKFLSHLSLNIDKAVLQNQLTAASQRDSLLDKTSALSFVFGAIYGRWDIRIAIDPSLAPNLPGPFDPLPACSPFMLIDMEGQPAEPDRIVSEEWLHAKSDANTLPLEGTVSNPTISDSEYPIRIGWNGILVDDPGFNGVQPHRDDIVRRIREVLDLLWKDKAHEIEQEACNTFGVSDLREYFRKPAKFFQDHLKRYSKSRRKAPIYWPLSTASGSYTIWFYYHRLTDQTLFTAVNKYVEPKISEIERGLSRIKEELDNASGGEATRLRDRLNETQSFLGELKDFRRELLRITALPYKPNLNDGVIINAAPLNGLFRLRSWADETKKVWDKLKNGEYDWAHSAYTIWPDRVKDVCRKDRSIAIAHGLEDICEVPIPASKNKGKSGRREKEVTR